MTEQTSPAPAEMVKMSVLPAQCMTILTLRRHNRYLLRPYLLLLRNDISGEASAVSEFTCAASALHAHAAFLKQIQKNGSGERSQLLGNSNLLRPDAHEYK